MLHASPGFSISGSPILSSRRHLQRYFKNPPKFALWRRLINQPRNLLLVLLDYDILSGSSQEEPLSVPFVAVPCSPQVQVMLPGSHAAHCTFHRFPTLWEKTYVEKPWQKVYNQMHTCRNQTMVLDIHKELLYNTFSHLFFDILEKKYSISLFYLQWWHTLHCRQPLVSWMASDLHLDPCEDSWGLQVLMARYVQKHAEGLSMIKTY